MSVVTDAAWGNAKERTWLEDSAEGQWEETPEAWIRHHRGLRRTSFHPGAARGGPDLHDLLPRRRIELYPDLDGHLGDLGVIEDEWCNANGIRVLKKPTWQGTTTFYKAKDNEGVKAKDIKLSCTTASVWNIAVFKLKRKTVDTLAAEGQALQIGVGSVHWHRLMMLEAFHWMMESED